MLETTFDGETIPHRFGMGDSAQLFWMVTKRKLRQYRFVVTVSAICLGGSCAEANSETDTAAAEANRFLQTIVLNLPDGKAITRTYNKHDYDAGWDAHYWQYSSFKWSLETESLTPADRLNGITWKGTINSTIDAYRSLYDHYDPNSIDDLIDGLKACWDDWRDMRSDMNFQWNLWKVNGKWKCLLVSKGWLGEMPLGEEAPKPQDAKRVLKKPNCFA